MTDERQTIMNSAERCFAREGYRGASMREIAREAGVNPATLYRYFPSKRALFDALQRPELDFPDPQRAGQAARIRAAALRVLARRGLALATMDEIAAEAGLTKGGVYPYFPSKEALFQAVLAQPPALDRVEPALQRIQADPTLPLEDCLAELGAAFLDALTEPDAASLVRILLTEGLFDPAIADTFREQVVARCALRIAEAMRPRLPLAPQPALAFWRFYFGSLFAWALLNRILPAANPMAETADEAQGAARAMARLAVHGVFSSGREEHT